MIKLSHARNATRNKIKLFPNPKKKEKKEKTNVTFCVDQLVVKSVNIKNNLMGSASNVPPNIFLGAFKILCQYR